MQRTLLCLLGRGAEKCKDGLWRPNRYIERLSANGRHSGIREYHLQPNDTDSRMVVAGTNANLLAGFYRSRQLSSQKIPHTILLAAGRAPYLENQDLPSEAVVMLPKLQRLFRKEAGTAPRILCATDSTCTHQDIRNALNTAAAEECNRIEFITVRTHLSRCQIMFELQAAKRRSAPPSEFLASEEILSRQNSKYCNLFRFLESLPAAHNTRTMEAIGVTKLRLGTYVFI